MKLIRAILWLVGLAVTVIGGAVCMQLESPQAGIFIVLIGLSLSGIVDAMDENFSLLRVGIRGVLMFASIAAFLLWRNAHTM